MDSEQSQLLPASLLTSGSISGEKALHKAAPDANVFVFLARLKKVAASLLGICFVSRLYVRIKS